MERYSNRKIKQKQMNTSIQLTPSEYSGNNRVNLAEALILQLPQNHEGRNNWLRHYGTGIEATRLRARIKLGWNPLTQSSFHNFDSTRAEESSKDLLKQLSNVPLTPKP